MKAVVVDTRLELDKTAFYSTVKEGVHRMIQPTYDMLDHIKRGGKEVEIRDTKEIDGVTYYNIGLGQPLWFDARHFKVVEGSDDEFFN